MAIFHQFPFTVSDLSWFEEARSGDDSYFATSSYIASNRNWINVSRWNSGEKKIEEYFTHEIQFPPTYMTVEPINGYSIVLSGVDVTVARIQQDLRGIANVYSFQIPNERDIIPITSHRCFTGTSPKVCASGLNGVLYFWDIESSRLEQTITTCHQICYDLDYNKDKPSLITSVGFDGKIVKHDRRIGKERNMLLYESTGNPILRVLWNKKDTNYISAFSLEDNSIITMDIRMTSQPAMYFKGHQSHVSSFCWSPYSAYSMYSCDISGKCLAWSFHPREENRQESYNHYPCFPEIASIQSVHPHPRESVAAIVTGNKVTIDSIQTK